VLGGPGRHAGGPGAAVEGQDDGAFDAAPRQGERQGAGDVGQAARFGEAHHLGSGQQDANGSIPPGNEDPQGNLASWAGPGTAFHFFGSQLAGRRQSLMVRSS
jgi:hypothetical protein